MDQCLFKCNGKVNSKDFTLHNKKLILHREFDVLHSKGDYHYDFDHSSNQNIFDLLLPSSVGFLELKEFNCCLGKKLKQLSRYEDCNNFAFPVNTAELDFHQLRHSICEFLKFSCIYLNSVNWDYKFLQNVDLENDVKQQDIKIRKYIARLYSLPHSLYHYAPSPRGNEFAHPGHHIYHLHLEMRWHFLAMTYSRHASQRLPLDNVDIDNVLRLIIIDLIYMAIPGFLQTSSTDLRFKSPFPCTCAREMWLMIQLFISDLNEKGFSKNFWDYVNMATDEMRLKSNDEKIFWVKANERKQTDLKNPEVFSIWLIFHLNSLFSYSRDGEYSTLNLSRVQSNHAQLKEILNSFLNKYLKGGERDNTEKELCLVIRMLHCLCNECWKPDQMLVAMIIKLLLGYFQSKMNQPFLLQSFGPWSSTFDNKSPADLLKEVRDRVEDDEQSKESSYGLFLRLIGIFLRNSRAQNEAKFWNQIRGRIYMKFEVSKMQELSDDGLYNWLCLLLTLAICADPADLCPRIFGIPVNLTDGMPSKKDVLIWKVKLAVLLLYKDLQGDLKALKMEDSFLNQINQMCCASNASSLMKHFVQVLHEILVSSEKLDRNEHILIDGWIDRYLSTCSKPTMVLLLETLCCVLEKCNKLDVKSHPILDSMWKHVVSRLRQIVFDPNLSDTNKSIANLAFAFTLEAMRNPAIAERHKHPMKSLFSHFATSIMIKDVRVIQAYLAKVLTNDVVVTHLRSKIIIFDHTLIQTWLKCCILAGGVENETSKLVKNFILGLSDMKDIFSDSFKLQSFRNSDAPFEHFPRFLAEKRNSLPESAKAPFDAKYRQYFQKIEKWTLMPITKENVDSELSHRIYNCIGMLLFECSSMFYIKTEPHNMFKMMIIAFLLPNEEKAHLKQLGRKIFVRVIQGIGRLNVKNDLHLQTLIQNLFDQYLPLLISSSECKVQDSLRNFFIEADAAYAQLILEKVASFIVVPNDNTTHKHCYLVILLLKSLVHPAGGIPAKVIEFVISICIPRVINCFLKIHDMHPHRKQTIELIRAIQQNGHYKKGESMRQNLQNAISSTVQKSFPMNGPTVFKFLHALLPVDAEIVVNLFPRVQDIIKEQEKDRRWNTESLKFALNQLVDAIKNQKRGN